MNLYFGAIGALAIGALASWVCLPFLIPFIWALVIQQVLTPLHRRLTARLSRTAAAAVMVVIIALAGVVPLTIVGGQLAYEATSAMQSFQGNIYGKISIASVQKKLDALPLPAPLKKITARFQLDEEVLVANAAGVGQKMLQFIALTATQIAVGAGMFIFNVIAFMFIFFFLCRDGKEWYRSIVQVVPTCYGLESLLDRLASSATAVFCGFAGTCLVQGTIGGIAFAALGLPSPFLAGAIMTICALVPAVGTALIWGPVALWLLVSGSVAKGVILIAIGAGVIGMIDNVTRPLLARMGGSQLSIVTITLGAIGGIAAFGLTGIIIGPLSIEAFSWLLQRLSTEEGELD